MASLSASAFAQTPKDAPAPTTWQPYTPPATVPKPIATALPVPPSVPDLPPIPTVVQPPKMVTFQKPANDAHPLPVMKPKEFVTPAAPVAPPRPVVQVPVPVATPAAPVATQPFPVSTQPAPVVARPAVMARPAPIPPVIPPTTMTQEPMPLGGTTGTLPTRLQLFRLDSDAQLNARIIKELGPEKSNDRFPVAQSLSPAGAKFEAKTAGYSPVQLLREPNYVVHRRLYFEEMNSERAGWDAGPAQGLFSTAYFYRDTLLFPMKIASGCKTPYDSSAGKCMPGDPTPYYYYPPSDITLFGGVVGTTIITGAAFILP